MKKQFLATVFFLAGVINLSAFANEKQEQVTGKMVVQYSDCNRTEGGSSCSGSKQVNVQFTIDLNSANHDNNNSGIYEQKFELKSGGYLFASVFVNHILKDDKTYYIISINVYGYDAEGKPLFDGGMVESSTEVYSLEALKNAATKTPIFLSGGKTQSVTVSTSELHSQK